MSCATYALACFINDKLLASSQYESAIFVLANSFLKSLKESIFNILKTGVVIIHLLFFINSLALNATLLGFLKWSLNICTISSFGQTILSSPYVEISLFLSLTK